MAVFGVAAAVTPVQVVRHTQQAQEVRTAHLGQQQERARERIELRLDQAEVAVVVLAHQLDAANAQHEQDQQQIDKLNQQISALTAYTAGYGSGVRTEAMRGATAALGPVAFPYGYCTWYVATRRAVTWSGNAIDWWANASGIRPEGQMPEVGAIMVSRESWWGHVAYVEAVVSSTVFVVREMNYTGWGVVDKRTVNRAVVPVVGFIY